MPSSKQHMTVLEMTHSKTSSEIASLKERLSPTIPQIVDISSKDAAKRAKLIKPLIGYDASALALSFVPADEPEDQYSYHHLRRDVFALASSKVDIESRYVVPSAHLTIARFIDVTDFSNNTTSSSPATCKMATFVQTIEQINAWLIEEYWPKDGKIKEGGEWRVGEGKGLDCRSGTLWYGDGESVMVGEGY